MSACPECGRDLVSTTAGIRRHACVGLTCGAWMPNNRERCARYSGHAGGLGNGHRSQFALDNQARERRGRWVLA